MAAAHDREKGHRPFFALVAVNWITRLCACIASNADGKPTQIQCNPLGSSLKLNFSGTTKEVARWSWAFVLLAGAIRQVGILVEPGRHGCD